MDNVSPPITTIRLSLGIICIGVILFFLIGLAGGYIGSLFAPSPITVLPNGDRTIVPVSQQVTISPSKKGEDITSTQGKSVLLLVKQTTKGILPIGTGIILTNDGVVMSTKAISDTTLFGLGEDGSLSALLAIGQDELSGIAFFRIPDQILPPVALAQSVPHAGSEVISIFRNEQTMRPTSSRHTLSGIVAPEGEHAPGIQQVAYLAGESSSLPVGAALFNDEGALVGAMREGGTPTMLLVPDITAALSRLSANTLTLNPFRAAGLTVAWKIAQDLSGVFGMRAVVSQVTLKTPAFNAGIKSGDIITSIRGKTITWDSELSELISKTPFTLSLIRQGEERTVAIP